MSHPKLHPDALPMQLETIEQIQARFASALDPLYHAYNEEQARKHRVGQKRKHVFDLESGLRMVVSREQYAPHQAPNLHISFSTFKDADERKMTSQEMLQHFKQVAAEISRGRLELLQIKVSEGGIVHMFFDADNFLAKLDETERKANPWVGRGKAT